MKALQLTQYGSIKDSLSFDEVNKPIVLSTDVLIQTKAAAINPIDKSIVLGNLQALLPIDLPSSIAYDVSGVIVEVGSEVKDFKAGDSVYSRVPQEQMGTIAEYVAVTSSAVAIKPENISFEEAASIPLAGLTAFQSFEAAGLKANDKVLIHAGSGGVGSFAIQYAKSKGAYVYTTTSTTNVEWVKELGADRVIDYKIEDYRDIVKDADIILDTLGQDYSLDAFKLIKKGGKVVSVVGPLDEATAHMLGMPDYKLPEEMTHQINATSGSYQFVFMHPNGSHLALIKTLIEENVIKPIIDTVYPFIESLEALEKLASGRAKGKIVIKIN